MCNFWYSLLCFFFFFIFIDFQGSTFYKTHTHNITSQFQYLGRKKVDNSDKIKQPLQLYFPE